MQGLSRRGKKLGDLRAPVQVPAAMQQVKLGKTETRSAVGGSNRV